jgi:hypothetical protein
LAPTDRFIPTRTQDCDQPTVTKKEPFPCPKSATAKNHSAPTAPRFISKANDIIAEYSAQGFQLTLRQLYYQFVSRDFIPNNLRSYKNLGDVINDARLAGLIDWNSIVDRTRNLQSLAHWRNPAEIIDACASQFRLDRWAPQPRRVEVWIEKDALIGVIEGICNSTCLTSPAGVTRHKAK